MASALTPSRLHILTLARAGSLLALSPACSVSRSLSPARCLLLELLLELSQLECSIGVLPNPPAGQGNVLFAGDRWLKLCDFGFAKRWCVRVRSCMAFVASLRVPWAWPRLFFLTQADYIAPVPHCLAARGSACIRSAVRQSTWRRSSPISYAH